jgi:hypothetical protein
MECGRLTGLVGGGGDQSQPMAQPMAGPMAG